MTQVKEYNHFDVKTNAVAEKLCIYMHKIILKRQNMIFRRAECAMVPAGAVLLSEGDWRAAAVRGVILVNYSADLCLRHLRHHLHLVEDEAVASAFDVVEAA